MSKLLGFMLEDPHELSSSHSSRHMLPGLLHHPADHSPYARVCVCLFLHPFAQAHPLALSSQCSITGGLVPCPQVGWVPPPHWELFHGHERDFCAETCPIARPLLVRHVPSQPALSFPTGGAQCWVPGTPHCPAQNLCSRVHLSVRMQMKWKNGLMYKGMIVRPCWGQITSLAGNRGPWHQGLAPPHDWGWSYSSSQLHFAFCLRLIKRYVTLILEIAWDGTCFHSMGWTWGFYSFLK